MESNIPPHNSIVCVDNTILFKAVYNPGSVVIDLFTELILKRSCILNSTEKNLFRCQKAVESKIIWLCEKLLKGSNPERLNDHPLLADAIDTVREMNKSKALALFTQEVIHQAKGLISQRLDFVKSFLEVHNSEFYAYKLNEAMQILNDPDADDEDAHLLAVAMTLHEKSDTPVYIWTDDTDFYNVEEILKGYSIYPFRRVK